MTINKAAILAGAFGGVVPSLLRVALNLTSDPPKHPIQDLAGYVVGVILLALLGAVITWIWQEMDLRKALYLGIGLPSLIQVVGLQSTQPGNTPPAGPPPAQNKPVGTLSLVSSAYAQTPASVDKGPFLIPGRKLEVSGNATAARSTVVFVGRDGQQVGTDAVTNPSFTSVDVPEAATTVVVRVGDSTSPPLTLPDTPNATKALNFDTGVVKGSGLLQAFGFGGQDQYQIKASFGEPTPPPAGFCKFGIQSNAGGVWTERLFAPAADNDASAIPSAGAVLIARDEINIRENLPKLVEGKGLYFQPVIGLLHRGQKIVVKSITPFKLAKDTHYWMEFTPADKQ
jgi:hypothetical protein